MSSIRIPAIVPPPIADCADLRKAFQGLGCNGVVVISILAHRSFEQRLQIKEAYGSLYKEDLMRRIKSELHFNFEKATVLWMLDPVSRDALILKDALMRSYMAPFSSWKRKRALVEMLCLQSAEDIHCLSQSYSSSFHRSLLEDLLASTEGPCRASWSRTHIELHNLCTRRGHWAVTWLLIYPVHQIFAKYLAANHDKNGGAGMELNRTASEGAQALHEATEGRADCINDVTFLHILTTKSRPALLSIFDTYKDVHGKDVYKAIRKGAVEDTQTIIREIVKFIINPPRFFAKTLYKSMKGLGTDDDTLIRVVVTRAEVDMKLIKSEFIRKYKVSLDRTIWSDTSGNYRQFLMALIGGNNTQKDSFLSKIL